jgi:hypothetical protein
MTIFRICPARYKEEPMNPFIIGFVLDCPDTDALAGFYAETLG